MKKSGNTTGVLKKPFWGIYGQFLSWVVALLTAFSLVAQEPDPQLPSQPSQTRAKTFVPSPSASDRVASAGQIKILDIEFSSQREDVPINEDKIRQNMRSSKGGIFSQQTVDGDIESLYATGDYSNVQIVTSEMRSEDGERGVRLSVLVDPKVRVSEVEVMRKRVDGGLDDQLSVDKEDLLDLKLKALTANEGKGGPGAGQCL